MIGDVKRFNLHRAETGTDPDDPPGFRTAWASIHRPLDARGLAGNLLIVEPHGAATPYHWESEAEEWLLVLDGTPIVRTPEGRQQLRPGDLVCFPAGEAGAHQVLNETDAPVRVVMLANAASPNATVYPDSGKLMIHAPGTGSPVYRQADGVDYWEGER